MDRNRARWVQSSEVVRGLRSAEPAFVQQERLASNERVGPFEVSSSAAVLASDGAAVHRAGSRSNLRELGEDIGVLERRDPHARRCASSCRARPGACRIVRAGKQVVPAAQGDVVQARCRRAQGLAGEARLLTAAVSARSLNDGQINAAWRATIRQEVAPVDAAVPTRQLGCPA